MPRLDYNPDFSPEPSVAPDDPQNFDRCSIRTPLRKRKPAKRASRVKMERERNPPGVDPKARRRTWPELFEARYAIALIHAQHAAHKPPEAWAGWVRDIICPGHLGTSEGIVKGEASERDGRYGLKGRYLITLHPGFQRWALFELVANPKHGPAYKLVSVAMEQRGSDRGEHAYLPKDLDRKRWGHLQGLIGDYREFNRRDFEIIRDVGDRRNQKKSQIEAKLSAPENAEVNEHARVQRDMDAAMIDDVWPWVTRAAGNAIVYGSDPEFAAAHRAEQESRLLIEQKNGYRIVARKDSEYARVRRTDAEVERREEAKREADQLVLERRRALDRETDRTDRLGRIEAVQTLERAHEEIQAEEVIDAHRFANNPIYREQIALRRRRQGTM